MGVTSGQVLQHQHAGGGAMLPLCIRRCREGCGRNPPCTHPQAPILQLYTTRTQGSRVDLPTALPT